MGAAMNRRGFFATIAAAFSAPAVPALAKPAPVARVALSSLPPLPADAIVIQAFRLLGVIAKPGRYPSKYELAEGRAVLDQVAAEIGMSPTRIPLRYGNAVSHALAAELAPMYGVCRGRGYYSSALKFHDAAFSMTWPKIGERP